MKNIEFDVIIILGNSINENGEPGDILKTRLDTGIEIFNMGLSKKIILTGSSVHNNFIEAKIMEKYCRQRKIPNDALLIEPYAKDTFENALFSKKIMDNQGCNSALIVTSKYHKLRTKRIFRKIVESFVVKTSEYPGDFSLFRKFKLYFWEICLILSMPLRRIRLN